eukprot:CAMPEP_0197651226 /NCGR_PEP_ID=MMETSP1338-20131121/31556_1 /TAXON_ID=43686 ORGANISM="Pelagodinium beii, Strain RCC1491" /NCGR_SAMPLE_ID=MMETSP1338 /ASSEMBLY_ACC=CAM_ASM_000754 /LENGTH=125 /DNA_ID=CAMNT_0043225807 /DNA_START=39 /DNA_END=416 /DNA_ORIENTATION=+
MAAVAAGAEAEAPLAVEDEPEEEKELDWDGESEANKIVQALCDIEKVQEKVKAAVEAQAKPLRAIVPFERLEAKRYKYSTGTKDTEFWVKCQINDDPHFVHILLTQEARVKEVIAFERPDSKLQA